MKQRHLTQTDVIARGWTRAVIEQYIPYPDKVTRSFAYHSPCYLYAREKVEGIENTPEWQARTAKVRIRRAAAKEAKSNHMIGRTLTGDSEGSGNLDLLHRECKQPECCERNCRALFDRSQAESFRANPNSEADAAFASAVSVIAIAYSVAFGSTSFAHRYC
jgi:hypothetical protein